MQDRPFRQVDVFTATAYRGNPVAVVLRSDGLSDGQMQAFARWTNLSETTFVLLPTEPAADYRLRIFTPGGEMLFAGHPTLGSCHAWLGAGGTPKSDGFITQQCGVGLVRIRRSGAQLSFAAPILKRSDVAPAVLARVAAALGQQATHISSAQLLDNGTTWLGILLDNPQRVLQLQPDFAQLKALGQKVGVCATYDDVEPGGDAATLEVRGFAPHMGINEDPVTGSLNASLAQWLISEGHVGAQYVAAQGSCLQRDGRVSLQRDSAGQVWVGGESVTCISGTVHI